jgi:ligand-binding sensor domain-containing protein
MSKEYATTLVSNEVWCMGADKNDIWVGTMRGVSRYDKGKDLWTTYNTESGLPNNEISSLCIDVENPDAGGDNIVWFGNNSGVTKYDKETGMWTIYTAKNGLASNKITCIAKGKNAIWFGTFDAGVIKYDKKTQNWQVYQRDDGLAHDCVLSIAVDDDKLWLGTPWGLSRYDTVTNSFTTYTEHDDPEDILEMVISSKDEPRPEDVYTGQVIGNKKSNKYHHPNSPSAKSILEENRSYFDSVEEAQAAGYERAGNFKVY